MDHGVRDGGEWDYYGIWRCSLTMSRELPPLGVIPIGGWATRLASGWRVSVEGLTLELLVSKQEIDFLVQCVDVEGMRCWVTGMAVVARAIHMIVPDEFSVYNVRNPTESTRLPSSLFGGMLANNLRKWTLLEGWRSILLPPLIRAVRHIHPLVCLHAPALPICLDEPHVCIGYVFAAHIEANATSGSGRVHGRLETPLGSSGFCYNHRLGCCTTEGTSIPCIPKGSIVVADSTKTLLLAARGVCRGHDPLMPSLIVAAREVVSAMITALSGFDITIARNAAELSAAITNGAPLVLASAELVAKQFTQVDASNWGRVVICDWCRAGAILLRARARSTRSGCTLLSCSVQITLAVAADVELFAARALDVEELALFLGAPADLLGSPTTLRELMRLHILRMEEQDANFKPVRRFEVVRFSSPTKSEREHSLRLPGMQTRMQPLLGSISNAGRNYVGVLPENVSIHEYFEKRGKRSSSKYTDASLRGDAAEDLACPLCFETMTARAVTHCGHWFCPRCILRALSNGFKQCPVCRQPLQTPKDVVSMPSSLEASTFLLELAQHLQRPANESQKLLLIAPFASCLERVARYLRAQQLMAWAWSGNAKQLQRNLDAFMECERGCLLCDPSFLSVRWLDLGAVKRVLVALPLLNDDRGICCQLRETLKQTPRASVTFLANEDAAVPSEAPRCDLQHGCPILVQELDV